MTASAAASVLDSKAVAYGVGILVGGVVIYFIGRKILGALGDTFGAAADAVVTSAKAVGTAINPASDKNLAYTGVNKIGSVVTGDEHWSLGGAIFDIFHPYDPNAPVPIQKQAVPARPEDKPSSLFSW